MTDWKKSICLKCVKQDVCAKLTDLDYQFECEYFLHINKIKDWFKDLKTRYKKEKRERNVRT